MELYSAVSGIEQALWDIAGKRFGVPVYNLLGGPCRDKIRVYANGWYHGAKTPDAYAAKAQQVVARGFTALKFDPFPVPGAPISHARPKSTRWTRYALSARL